MEEEKQNEFLKIWKDFERNNVLIQKILQQEKLYDEVYCYNDNGEAVAEKNTKIEAEILEKLITRFTDKLEMAEKLIGVIPLYYDEAENFWMWDLVKWYWKRIDETDLLITIDKAVQINILNSKEKTEIMTAIKMKARQNKPKEVPKTWLQFDKLIVDIETGDKLKPTPEYFFTSPIPHRLGRVEDTPILDKLFREWVKEEDVQKLYEIFAFCLYREYFIERIICLLGSGANGKSTYLKILQNFLGVHNITSTSLETLLKSRFETTKLYQKLCCLIGETNLSHLENSQLIKRLTSGKDLISLEWKNKGFLDYINFAKLIVATNNLPPTDDKTEGFYRRWLIINFPNRFENEKDIISSIPESEYENLCCKCLFALNELIKNRKFTNEGTIEQRKQAYEEKSNPFDKFFNEFIEEEPNSDIPFWELKSEFLGYLKQKNLREWSDKAITNAMKEKGIEKRVLRKEWYENDTPTIKQIVCFLGVKWKK